MTFFDSVFLGALEGLTEFLPISSTGHLVLASTLLGIAQTEAVKSFEIAIQLGSILAVVVLFWREFLNRQVLVRLVVAFLPTAFIGFTLYRIVKDVLLGNPFIVVVALFIGGVLIILIERSVRTDSATELAIESVSLKQSFLIGLAQSLALIPGVSRSGATVMGGLLMKLPRATVFKFSFLLAVPTMLAATAYDLLKTPDALAQNNAVLLSVGFLVAFFVALLTVKAAMAFVKRYSFTPFGWYRIVLALLFWFFVL